MRRYPGIVTALTGATLLVLATAPATARAQTSAGPQVNYLGGAGVGVGARITTPLGTLFGVDEGIASQLHAAAAFDYYFMDDASDGTITVEQSYWELNFYGSYPFTVEADVEPYVGAGLSFAQFSQALGSSSKSESEVGVNFAGGLRLIESSIPVFFEVRYTSIRFLFVGSGQSSGLSGTLGLQFPI